MRGTTPNSLNSLNSLTIPTTIMRKSYCPVSHCPISLCFGTAGQWQLSLTYYITDIYIIICINDIVSWWYNNFFETIGTIEAIETKGMTRTFLLIATSLRSLWSSWYSLFCLFVLFYRENERTNKRTTSRDALLLVTNVTMSHLSQGWG